MAIKAELKGSYLLLYFLLTALVFTSPLDEPYCALRYRRLCQGKGRHVGCQYPYPGPGATCRNYTQIIFTEQLRHFIVNYINKRRQRVAAGTERVKGGALIPKPRIMMMVVWDRELALLAQRLADQCTFIHDDCRATVRYPYSGQTVGEVRWRGAGAADARRAVRRVLDAWWGERRRVRPEQLFAPFRMGTKGAAWGHFSQLAVWALAAAGCGAARHGAPRRLLLVCDFSHTNMLGQSTLQAGERAPCPRGAVRRQRSPFPLLCAPVRPTSKSENVEDSEYESYSELTEFPDDGEDIHGRFTKRTSTRSQRRQYMNATKPRIIEKLDRELVMKGARSTELNHRQWCTARADFVGVRENNEKEVMSKARFKIYGDDSPYQTTEDLTTEYLRRKWKQTRHRPRRPGAVALLNKPAAKIHQHSSGSHLTLDTDDMEQLFRDTGFHKHWKKAYSP